MVPDPNPVSPSPTPAPLPPSKKPYERQIVWKNAIGFLILHLIAFYATHLYFLFKVKWQTHIFATFLGLGSSNGILLGAHRYYTHRSFKATLPLQIYMLFWQTVASQNCLWVWVRDHRQHHKYSDTDADPHNASRGFFFSHIGWLMVRKHPDVIEKGKTIDMSDLNADPLVMFQKKYYTWLYLVVAFAFPILAPVYLWDETWANAFLVPFVLRMVGVLNFTWMVNSWAHAFGTKPYDKNIRSTETILVSVLSLGEGWHNYHHAFPWDYKASDFGVPFNPTTGLINLLARLGLVYDLKEASPAMVRARALRTGDGSYLEICDKEKATDGQKETVADGYYKDKERAVDGLSGRRAAVIARG